MAAMASIAKQSEASHGPWLCSAGAMLACWCALSSKVALGSMQSGKLGCVLHMVPIRLCTENLYDLTDPQ